MVERTQAWYERLRRLAVRYKRRADIHEAFLSLGSVFICLGCLETGSCEALLVGYIRVLQTPQDQGPSLADPTFGQTDECEAVTRIGLPGRDWAEVGCSPLAGPGGRSSHPARWADAGR